MRIAFTSAVGAGVCESECQIATVIGKAFVELQFTIQLIVSALTVVGTYL